MNPENQSNGNELPGLPSIEELLAQQSQIDAENEKAAQAKEEEEEKLRQLVSSRSEHETFISDVAPLSVELDRLIREHGLNKESFNSRQEERRNEYEKALRERARQNMVDVITSKLKGAEAALRAQGLTIEDYVARAVNDDAVERSVEELRANEPFQEEEFESSLPVEVRELITSISERTGIEYLGSPEDFSVMLGGELRQRESKVIESLEHDPEYQTQREEERKREIAEQKEQDRLAFIKRNGIKRGAPIDVSLQDALATIKNPGLIDIYAETAARHIDSENPEVKAKKERDASEEAYIESVKGNLETYESILEEIKDISRLMEETESFLAAERSEEARYAFREARGRAYDQVKNQRLENADVAFVDVFQLEAAVIKLRESLSNSLTEKDISSYGKIVASLKSAIEKSIEGLKTVDPQRLAALISSSDALKNAEATNVYQHIDRTDIPYDLTIGKLVTPRTPLSRPSTLPEKRYDSDDSYVKDLEGFRARREKDEARDTEMRIEKETQKIRSGIERSVDTAIRNSYSPETSRRKELIANEQTQRTIDSAIDMVRESISRLFQDHPGDTIIQTEQGEIMTSRLYEARKKYNEMIERYDAQFRAYTREDMTRDPQSQLQKQLQEQRNTEAQLASRFPKGRPIMPGENKNTYDMLVKSQANRAEIIKILQEFIPVKAEFDQAIERQNKGMQLLDRSEQIVGKSLTSALQDRIALLTQEKVTLMPQTDEESQMLNEERARTARLQQYMPPATY